MKIGFVGLGIMGGAMASNLLKAGFTVTVWNRSLDKCSPLVDLGATVAASPRGVAESSDVVIAMMATPAAVLSVRDGAEGIIAGLSTGNGYVDMSNVDADTSLESYRLAHEKGAQFFGSAGRG